MANPLTKVCHKADCPFNGIPQPLADFAKDKRRKYGRGSLCKTCHNKRNRENYYDPRPIVFSANALYLESIYDKRLAAIENAGLDITEERHTLYIDRLLDRLGI